MSEEHIVNIETAKLMPQPGNPEARVKDVAGLARSIKEEGVNQPLIVRLDPRKPGAYEIVSGHRRHSAAGIAGLSEVPCIVRKLSDQEAARANLIENAVREDLDPFELADAITGLQDLELSYEQIAQSLGLTAAKVARAKSLNELSPAWRKERGRKGSRVGEWPISHFIKIARLPKAAQDDVLKGLSRWKLADGIPRAVDIDTWISDVSSFLRDSPFSTTADSFDGGWRRGVPKCAACPKRSSHRPMLWDGSTDDVTAEGGIPKGDRCLDRACWDGKKKATLRRRLADLRKSAPKAIVITRDARKADTGTKEVVGKGLHEATDYKTVKKTDPKAIQAINLDAKGGPALKYVVSLYGGANGGGSGGSRKHVKGQVQTLAERRLALEAKRSKHIVDRVVKDLKNTIGDKERLDAIAEVWSEQCILVSLVSSFGTMSHADHIDSEALHVWDRDGSIGDASIWETFEQRAGKPGSAEAPRVIAAEVIRVLIQRLKYNGLGNMPALRGEAEQIRLCFGGDFELLEAEANEAVPVPASWLKLNEDSTPKTTEKPADKAASKPASGAAKKKVKAKPAAKAAKKVTKKTPAVKRAKVIVKKGKKASPKKRATKPAKAKAS